MNPYFIYLLPFFYTVILESLTNKILLKEKTSKVLLYTFLINLFTWPIANIIFGIGVNFFIIELIVIFVESFLIMLLFKTSLCKSFSASLVANIITSLMTYISL